MKKAIAFISAAALTLMPMAGCSDNEPESFGSSKPMPMETFSLPSELPFNAEYIRLGELGGAASPDPGYFPYCQVIKSPSELQDFIESEKQSFDFENGYENGGVSFISHAQKYNEEFFYENVLFVIMRMETSGSIRLEVTDVLQENNEITVKINESSPEVATDDIAYWAVLVEAPVDDYGGGPAAAQFSFEENSGLPPADDMKVSERLNFNAEYHMGAKNIPDDYESFVITSEKEFKKALGASSGEYGYDKKFFKDKAIIAVVVEERSGSIGHEVTDVIKYDGKISVGINRICPEIGTCDMAEWTILIEISAEDYSGEALDIQFNTVEE